MRDNVKNIAKLIGETRGLLEPVVEIGSFQVPGQEEYADIRPLFEGVEFIGCDMREGPGVDRVENVEQMTFDEGSVGTILMLDTLEHVANCHTAMHEAFRVLKPGGLVAIVSVMDFAVHLHPSDYWRFTPQGFELLLEQFEPRWVFLEGNPFCPHTVIGYGVKPDGSAATPAGLRQLITRTRRKAVDLTTVDYDDPALLDGYPFHTAHDGYARYAEVAEDLSRLKNQLAEQDGLLNDYRAAVSDQQAELTSIQSSLGWRALQRLRRMRRAVLPPSTAGGRAYEAIRRKFR